MHAFPSLQAVPLSFAGLLHTPVAGAQLPTLWHWSLAAHTTGFPPVHIAAWQVSVCVHALPSLQVVPSSFTEPTHCPVAGSQAEAWHWSLGVHTKGFPPMQIPFWQESVCVHGFPSLHPAPLIFAGLLHTPLAGSQVSGLWH